MTLAGPLKVVLSSTVQEDGTEYFNTVRYQHVNDRKAEQHDRVQAYQQEWALRIDNPKNDTTVDPYPNLQRRVFTHSLFQDIYFKDYANQAKMSSKSYVLSNLTT